MRKVDDHPPMRGALATEPTPALRSITKEATPSPTKLLLVDFRSGEAVDKHPEIAPFLSKGWHVHSAVPRIVEAKGTQLLVVLSRAAARPSFAAEDADRAVPMTPELA